MANNVNDLHKYEKNPRKITSSQQRILSKGLLTYGDLSGIVFNIQNKQLVGGNQRTDFFNKSDEIILIERFNDPDEQGTVAYGYIVHDGKKYNYREVSWDENTHASACLMANKAGGDWDWLLVKDIGNHLDTGAFDMELTGFDSVEWENLLASTAKPLEVSESRDENMKERAENYGAQGLSKFEMWIEDEEYDDFKNKLTAVMEMKNLDTFSDTLRLLVLEAFEQNFGTVVK